MWLHVTLQVTCCLHSGTGSGRRRGRRRCWLSAACRGWWCRAPPGTRSGPRWTCRLPPRGWGNRGNCWCLRRYHVFLFFFGTRKENLLIHYEFYNVWKERINVRYIYCNIHMFNTKHIPWVKFWTIRSRGCWFTSFKVLRGQTGIEIWHFEVHGPLAHQVFALLLSQGPVCRDNKVGLAVLVNQSAAGLHILEAQVFAKQSIGDHPAGTSFQHWKTLKG